jgi:hypothetical protein
MNTHSWAKYDYLIFRESRGICDFMKMWCVPQLNLIMMHWWPCVFYSSLMCNPRGIFVYSCLSRDMSSAVPFMHSQKVSVVDLVELRRSSWFNKAESKCWHKALSCLLCVHSYWNQSWMTASRFWLSPNELHAFQDNCDQDKDCQGDSLPSCSRLNM